MLLEIFGIKNTATFDEIKDAYFDSAKKYHPDRISSAPDPEIKEKANFVFAEINKAYETLTDDEKKREYDILFYFGDFNRNSSFYEATKPHNGFSFGTISFLFSCQEKTVKKWIAELFIYYHRCFACFIIDFSILSLNWLIRRIHLF